MTVSGFSSGAFITSNFAAWFNEFIHGVAMFMGGGPCPTRGFCNAPHPVK